MTKESESEPLGTSSRTEAGKSLEQILDERGITKDDLVVAAINAMSEEELGIVLKVEAELSERKATKKLTKQPKQQQK